MAINKTRLSDAFELGQITIFSTPHSPGSHLSRIPVWEHQCRLLNIHVVSAVIEALKVINSWFVFTKNSSVMETMTLSDIFNRAYTVNVTLIVKQKHMRWIELRQKQQGRLYNVYKVYCFNYCANWWMFYCFVCGSTGTKLHLLSVSPRRFRVLTGLTSITLKINQKQWISDECGNNKQNSWLLQ